MPPWGADPAHGTFKNDPRLTEKEIETIVAWVDAGAPKGDDKDLPAAPKFADGWTIGKPDAIFTMDEEFTIPADGTMPVQVLQGADRPDRRQVDSGDRDPPGRARRRCIT